MAVARNPSEMTENQHPGSPLRDQPGWQSRLLLLLILPVLACWLTLRGVRVGQMDPPVLWQAMILSLGLTLAVWRLRAATLGGALAGGAITATLYFWTPGWHTALWPLLGLLLLTFVSTRFGRARKLQQGTAEGSRGRSAAQVISNLGVAAMCAVPLSSGYAWSGTLPGRTALVAMVAALAEATADTLASELGQVIGGTPRMLTSLRRVPPGTDGAISLKGTVAGVAGAAAVALLAGLVLPLRPREIAVSIAAGTVGLFVDTLLGALLELRGWINNDAVNCLSTLASALLAARMACRWVR